MLERMLKQYIETALWSSYDEREEDGGELLDKVPNNIKNTKDLAHDLTTTPLIYAKEMMI